MFSFSVMESSFCFANVNFLLAKKKEAQKTGHDFHCKIKETVHLRVKAFPSCYPS